jgi:hypothetical protein
MLATLVVLLLLVCTSMLWAGPVYAPSHNWDWTQSKLQLQATQAAGTPMAVPTGLNFSGFWKFSGGERDDFAASWTVPLDNADLFYFSALKSLNNADYGFTVGTQGSKPLGWLCKLTKWTPSAQVMAVSDATTLYIGRMSPDFKDLSQGWGGGLSVAVLQLH